MIVRNVLDVGCLWGGYAVSEWSWASDCYMFDVQRKPGGSSMNKFDKCIYVE